VALAVDEPHCISAWGHDLPARVRRWGVAAPPALACALVALSANGGPAGAGRHHSPAAVAPAPESRCARPVRHNLCYACATAAGRAAAAVA